MDTDVNGVIPAKKTGATTSINKLSELESKYSRIVHVVGDATGVYGAKTEAPWEVVYRKADRPSYKYAKQLLFNEKKRSEAFEFLACASVVYVKHGATITEGEQAASAFQALLEDWPAVCEASAKKLSALNGLNEEDDEGK